MIQKRATSETFTVAEAASFLKISEHTAEVLASQKELPARRVGGRWQFQKSELEDYLRNRSPRDRMLAQAGVFEHDQDLPKILAKIKRDRRRQGSKRR